MRKFIIYMLFLFTFFGCTKVVNIEMHQDNPKQVLNCLFTPDKIFEVYLAQSVPILDNHSGILTNGTIELYKNGVFVETLFFNGDAYQSSSIVELNNNYKLKSFVEGFDVVEATDYSLKKPILSNASLTKLAYFDEDGSAYAQTTFEINDDVTEHNYYELIIQRIYEVEGETITDRAEYDDVINDPILLNEEILAYNPSSIVFGDDLFNGTNYNLKVNFFRENIVDYGVSGDGYIDFSIKIILRSITENYFQYKKRLIMHSESLESDIWDGVVEPIPMYSNVENGFGIFAGYNEIEELID